ncbi:MAG: hypothetical protein SGPRY_009338, partial [Prymnesium sp.]
GLAPLPSSSGSREEREAPPPPPHPADTASIDPRTPQLAQLLSLVKRAVLRYQELACRVTGERWRTGDICHVALQAGRSDCILDVLHKQHLQQVTQLECQLEMVERQLEEERARCNQLEVNADASERERTRTLERARQEKDAYGRKIALQQQHASERIKHCQAHLQQTKQELAAAHDLLNEEQQKVSSLEGALLVERESRIALLHDAKRQRHLAARACVVIATS